MFQTGKKIFVIILFSLFISNILFGQKIGGWYTTDSLKERKHDHAGIQLNDGNILVTGGYTPSQNYPSNETEMYDVKSQSWKVTTPMNKGRAYHNLIKLKDGSILAIGGFSERSCEILNSDYTKWTFTDSLETKKYYGQNVVLLQDGNVLVTGGYVFASNDTTGALKECELYNYSEQKWEIVSKLNTGRYDHFATLLNDGKVLVTGGKKIYHGVILLNTCEIFDPVTKEWSYTTPMNYPRAGHSATLLSNGKVLAIGGQQRYSELYDPATKQWEIVGQVNLASGQNKAIEIMNGKYLLLVHDFDGYITRCGWELYSLKDYVSVYVEKFTRNIIKQAIARINENLVLVAGGSEAIISGAELYIVTANFCQIYDFNLTSIKENNNNNLPKDFYLGCYPNPFNGTTNLTIKLSSTKQVLLNVYNILGEMIKTIYNGELSSGKHTFQLNLDKYSSGVYFVRMSSLNKVQLIKIIHQK
ncbi:MAG: kelch repeat-containing protein [Melioribacteraceae bacterium]